MKILVSGGATVSLLVFRMTMLRAMMARGHTVVACGGDIHRPTIEALRKNGVDFHAVPLDRRGISAVGDLRYWQGLRRLMDRVKPDAVLSYALKPVIYGSFAARGRSGVKVYSMITGSGAAAAGGDTVKRRMLGGLVRSMCRAALRNNHRVFFQNHDDANLFISKHVVRRQQVVMINGSGVDLDEFAVAEPMTDPIQFLLIARLMPDKGIREYAAAAKILLAKYPNVRFKLLGPYETVGSRIEPAEVQAWQDAGILDYQGAVSDVRPLLAQASVFVLPSYYGEGQPRSVLEALAMGRPVVTADSPGCRETVVDGDNGFLVPPRDATALAAALERFILEPERIAIMGRAARRVAEAKYNVHDVNRTILDAMNL